MIRQNAESTRSEHGLGYMLALVLALFLSGCDGKSRTNAPSEPQALTMPLNQEFEIRPGDEVQPIGVAEIRVRHVVSTNTKYVTVTSGSAQLSRGDYVAE